MRSDQLFAARCYCDGDDDDDCPLTLRKQSSMHSLLVAQARGDVKISNYNQSITDVREKKEKKKNKLSEMSGGGCGDRGWVGVGMSLKLWEKVCLQQTLEIRGGRINFEGLGKATPEGRSWRSEGADIKAFLTRVFMTA